MSGKYQAYPEYKDSGVEWLGNAPSDWSIHALKRAVHGCVNGMWGDEPDGEKDLTVLRVADFDRVKLAVSDEKLTTRSIPVKDRKNRQLARGDLLIEKSGGGEKTLVGCVVKFDKDYPAVTSNFVAKMTPRAGFDSGFLTYAFAHLYAGRVNYPSIKQTTGIQNLDSDAYLMERFVFPSFAEQRTIATFLDHETARIDRLIEKQQRLIELLKEKRQAVISHAVSTRPTEPTAKLGYFVDLLPGYAFPSSGFEHSPEGNVKLLRGTNVGVGSLRWDDVVYWPSCDRMKLKPFELEAGDIVFGMDRPWISSGARVAEVLASDLPCLLLQRVARIRTHENTYQPFVKMCLASHEFKSYVESDLTGVSVPHISPEQIKNFPIRAIGFENQKRLTDEVNCKLEKFNRIEAEATKAILLMEERRTALISAAVTGKIDVRNWQPNTGTQAAEPDLPMAAEQAGRYHV